MNVLGEIRSYGCLHRIMRERAEELGLSRENIDAYAGLQSGYAGKVLAPNPTRKIGPWAMSVMLPTLAIKLLAVECPENLAKLQARRAAGRLPVRSHLHGKHAGTVSFVFSRRHMREIQKRGGQNSRKNLSPERRTELARKAGLAGAKARWGARRNGR